MKKESNESIAEKEMSSLLGIQIAIIPQSRRKEIAEIQTIAGSPKQYVSSAWD